MKNSLKTLILLVAISALFMFVGGLIGGGRGMTTALVMSLAMNFGAYWFSDKIVLSMHRAQPLGPGHPSQTYEIVQDLCMKAKLPMPKVYLIPEWTPNAFATGRNPQNAAVAVTEGILKILDKRELRGVLAHEMSHVANRDILVSTVVASVASAIMYLGHMMQWAGLAGRRDGEGRGVNPLVLIVTIFLAPIAASLIQAAVSRAREFMADESGANVSQDPEALASALEKISNPDLARSLREDRMSDMRPAMAHLYIVNNFQGANVLHLFSTHPPVKERVARLRAMSSTTGRI